MPLYILENGSESVWAKVILNESSHYFGCWYNDPETPVDHIQLLREHLDKITGQAAKNKTSHIHLLGDFNYPNIDWSSKCDKDGKTLSRPLYGTTNRFSNKRR